MVGTQNTRLLSCTKCEITFASKFSQLRHERNFHGSSVKDNFEETHTFTFHTEDEFKSWKDDLENKTCSKFIKDTGVKGSSGYEITYLKCQRSGSYRPLQKSERQRQMKIQGSVKVGKKCSARMKIVKESMFGGVEITVTLWPHHDAHAFDPEAGSTRDKLTLGSRKRQGIRKEYILKDLQTTSENLHNISINLELNDDFLLDKEDAASVDLTVKTLRSETDNPVLLYKPQGIIDDYLTQFGKNDFLLAIMNDVQLSLLSLYGNSVVQIDSTNGTNQQSIHLTTLTVNDANDEAVPVAVLFSNRDTTDVFEAFFQQIKERLTADYSIIAPKVFISDDQPAFYNAWEQIFGPTPIQLLCTWHVEKTFKSKLTTKITDPSVRDIVAKELTSLHHETDRNKFETLFDYYMKAWISNDETKSFAEYFLENYSNRKQLWALCYRQLSGVNTNTKLDSWHREMKYCGGDGKVIKRVDKAVYIISNAVNRKIISQVVNIERAKVTAKIVGLKRRHRQSVLMSNDGILHGTEGSVWFVPSSETSNSCLITYIVKKERDACLQNCDVQCDACNTCIHQYSCTCIDNLIKMQMCKHIHKVCTLFFTPKKVQEVEDDSYEMIIDIDVRNEGEEIEVYAVSNQIFSCDDSKDFEANKTSFVQAISNDDDAKDFEVKKSSCLSLLQANISSLKTMITQIEDASTNDQLVNAETVGKKVRSVLNSYLHK